LEFVRHGYGGTKAYQSYCNRKEKYRRDWPKRWNIFAYFLEDVGKPPNNDSSIDLIDKAGKYEPGNVHWIPARPRFKHGMVNTKVYKAWEDMKKRCLNKNNPRFDDYGGRGIHIYSPWLEFEAFYKDVGDPPEGHRIGLDRIDNNKGYFPDNIRWASPSIQTRNRRPRDKTGMTSNYEGVSWDKEKGRWVVRMASNGGIPKHIGRYDCEEEAAAAYQAAKAERDKDLKC
jgi:hypothetical protein